MDENKEKNHRKRILLTVAYDGTAYHGWQIQPNGITIEEKLNEALCELTGESICIIGASRTDAGVHALGNLAVFDTNSRIAAKKFAPALNARLPEDIRIMEAREVEPHFHPRHIKTKKTYEYRIYTGRVENPIGRNYAHFVYAPLDVRQMQRAAEHLVGEHDFKSFCTTGAQVLSTVRTIYEAKLRQEDDYLIFKITGDGFLLHMVRIIVGTLLEVGRGSLKAEAIPDILDAKDRRQAGPTAPARGLTLLGYEF